MSIQGCVRLSLLVQLSVTRLTLPRPLFARFLSYSSSSLHCTSYIWPLYHSCSRAFSCPPFAFALPLPVGGFFVGAENLPSPIVRAGPLVSAIERS